MRASAMAAAGIVLSQPTTHTAASKRCPRQTNSMESAIPSRLTSDAFMPSVPMVSQSEMAMVLNSIGVPPAARIPSFTLAERRRRWKLQGMVSIQVLATAINGLARSASVRPMALYMARAGAWSRPSVMLRLRCLRSMSGADSVAESCNDGATGVSPVPRRRRQNSGRARTPLAPFMLGVYYLRLRRLCLACFLLLRRQPRHHRPQLLAYFFNRVLLFALAQLGKILATALILGDPFPGEAAILDSRQHFLHRLARRISDNHFAAGQVAVLGRVRNRIAHAAQSAFVDQVDDQLHLVHALEVGNLGGVAGRHQRLETFLHQRSQSAAEYSLFAEQVALGFFFESCLQHASARRADAVRNAKAELMRASARILVDGQQRGHAAALRIHAPHQMAGALRRNHDHVHIFWRLDGLEVNRKAVRETENFAFVEGRLDGRFVEFGLSLVRRENLDPVGALGGFGWSDNRHAVRACLLGGTALGIEADDDVVSAVTQVLRLRVALGAVSENGDGFAL